MAIADRDGFNWGYDPWHFSVPEGSYATDPEGPGRTLEFRRMVAALAGIGLRVVLDVVYNHTVAAGQDSRSVLDRIVPGYYQRLSACGAGRELHLLLEHRGRAHHDGEADRRLRSAVGAAVQGRRLPVRSDGSSPAVDDAGRPVSAGFVDARSRWRGRAAAVRLRRGLELRRGRRECPVRPGHPGGARRYRDRDLQRSVAGCGSRRRSVRRRSTGAGFRHRSVHRPQPRDRCRTTGPATR